MIHYGRKISFCIHIQYKSSHFLPLRWGEEFFAEEGDEVAEQLFLAGRIVLVIADGVTIDGYQLGGS